MLTVERSPARVCWHIMCNGQVITTTDTKREARAEVLRLSKKYGLS